MGEACPLCLCGFVFLIEKKGNKTIFTKGKKGYIIKYILKSEWEEKA